MLKNTPPILTNREAHYMKPGAVAFVPGWIILLMTILTLSILFPSLFSEIKPTRLYPIHPSLLFFIIGSLMPVFDDLFAFLFGSPFAHHSLFHSFMGVILTFIIFLSLGNYMVAKYALLGNLYHISFNFYLDYVTLLFPFSYKEFGLTDVVRVSTYWLKVIHYPIIFGLFAFSILHFIYS